MADLLAIGLIILFSFSVGLFIRTQLGKMIFSTLEKKLLHSVPLYSTVKETVMQFSGQKRLPFSKIALVNIFGNETRMTAFITDEHPNGDYTVFVPTGPNPTSGNIYHVEPHQVELVDVPVETAMRSIIACGSGSETLLLAVEDQRTKTSQGDTETDPAKG